LKLQVRKKRVLQRNGKMKKTALWFGFISILLSAFCFGKCALVTGGAGFLGSHMCERLLNEGYQVICLDNLYTGNTSNIQRLCKDPKFSFILLDVINPFDPEVKIDEIYNFACPASPPHYQRDPVKTLKTSVLGAIHLLELARKYQAKIFQASTSEVYGDPSEHPQKETYWGNVNPVGIRSCYDEGKRCVETFFFDYHRQYGIKIKVGRIFNTYGPRMDMHDGRVVSNFIVQALNNKPLTIYGDGSQTRSFCYVADLIDAIRYLMESPDSFIGPVNLGNPAEFTVSQLAEKVLQLTRSSSEIIFLPLPSDDPKKRCPDITLAKKILNWSPVITLEEGLKATIPYFESLMDEPCDLFE
jgi:UDP-glucuronate decarboxylase